MKCNCFFSHRDPKHECEEFEKLETELAQAREEIVNRGNKVNLLRKVIINRAEKTLERVEYFNNEIQKRDKLLEEMKGWLSVLREGSTITFEDQKDFDRLIKEYEEMKK